MTLRTDPRQWLSYGEAGVEAAMRALEMLALESTGRALADHPNIELRGIGNAMLKLADARARAGLGLIEDAPAPTDELASATRSAVRILNWLTVGGEYPIGVADDLYAAIFYLDSRLNRAGLSGPGLIRRLARGDL